MWRGGGRPRQVGGGVGGGGCERRKRREPQRVRRRNIWEVTSREIQEAGELRPSG